MSGSFFGGAMGGDFIERERIARRNAELDANLESCTLNDTEHLDDNHDTFNNETFDAQPVGTEFDFFSSTQANQARLSQSAQPGVVRKGMTMEEFEAQFAPKQAQVVQQQQPEVQGGMKRADEETVAHRREQRLQRQAALAKYDGMMSRRDKEYIIRIQISQLLTDDPMADDFYSHMFQLSRGAAQSLTQSPLAAQPMAHTQPVPQSVAAADLQGLLGETPRVGRGQRSNTMARMQQQVQRIVNEARRRPKVAHVAAEGALGRISINSARNPKQAIQVQHDAGTHDAGPHGAARGPAASRRATLRAVETAYGAVLRMEQQVRAQQPSDAAYAEAREQAWTALGAAQPILNEYPHPLVRFLGVAKGTRLIPRLVPHLSVDQVLALTTTIIANFESLDVCRFGSFSLADAQRRDATALFLHAAMPPALAFMADTPLQIVNGLFALFMERNNVAWVARTRPAQVFLAVVLRRTAALKQAYADSAELFQAAELYAHLFNALRGNITALFPPPPPPSQLPGPADDVHAWQFLAALAAAASVEQQHMLVSEARGHVLTSVQLAKSGHLPSDVASAITANVNLFLNALGLDASQVAA
ncbi:DNA topoisomerase 2-associated protein pat1 [Coemansia sp. RSA 353]|nr:DNA topoisomerase 2-associated protein pat1 [Coemansia sp. RSA 1591]KAJ1762288.1 DNA topoisomerase 2-associated protein pat1 [Coemansia sp. RSA 1752]KAJ1788777.1 DNA topoisomerase 2-associated protein pat1 [Coemansia sp. RSA 1938]KAJ2144343.1 DNA topoisomerase 2-associated protein pat1 [Coemansia sp. RSA 564]KAJ2168213.1 DNA topoisomerase 2-associated protein pat1 [Coemansia sp. RSA 562]KAJ2185238.1 DNA topoisomerase 2-associated protein pat1 [Coemansia sp. RSA 532]KAJ2293700.1 DNA topoiso